jgi:hypothetical protein
MRIESNRALKNGGWLHKDVDASRLGARVNRAKVNACTSHRPGRVTPDFNGIIEKWEKWASPSDYILGAASLGVSTKGLRWLGAVPAPLQHRVLAFPMSDHNAEIIGIRFRSETGQKWAVRGSKQGLFIPLRAIGTLPTKPTLICEGQTDTLAALDCGYFAIGRPACRGQEKMLIDCLRNLGIKQVVICADQDDPGQDGARNLREIMGDKFKLATLNLPKKDLRMTYTSGGSAGVKFAVSQVLLN